MSETKELTGRCMCGAFELTAKDAKTNVGACHCQTCRRWVGGPFLAVDCGSQVEVKDPEKLGVFNSSEWAERAYCKDCGSAIFYRLKQNQMHIVSAGLFDEKEAGFVLDHQVFVDKNPGYYAFANKTEDMTEEQVFAMFS